MGERRIPETLEEAYRLRDSADSLQERDFYQEQVYHLRREEYRSRGITTLLVEKVGLELAGPDGWLGSGASALRVWAPYWQDWRRRSPSYTSSCQVCAPWVSGSFTVALTVGRWPASAGNDQYR